MKKNFSNFTKKPKQYFSSFSLHGSSLSLFIQLCYFMILSLLGYLGLKVSKPRTPVRPNDIDLFFTSVSASTVSSMVAIEMEVFSNSQLILITFLMLFGGEVFTSMLDLIFSYFKFTQNSSNQQHHLPINNNENQIELSVNPQSQSENHKQIISMEDRIRYRDRVKYNNRVKYLTVVVSGYLILIHLVGFSLVTLYITVIESARQVLRNKGIKVVTFSLFTVVSTFASCGFVPTNENMMVFKKNSGLLLLILPYVFLGNTLYPPCLRLMIMILKKVKRSEEFCYLLGDSNSNDMGYRYEHLLSSLHCWLLIATVFGFVVIQMVVFCSMEWNNATIMEGLNVYEKVIACLFQVANARHAGESVFDLSALSSAILVLFIVMMYLPPYTRFVGVKENAKSSSNSTSILESVVFSQLSYLVIFIILICITEKQSLKEDPLNFNVLNITLEVISAYGNVGFSTGYSCSRKLENDGRKIMCKDSWVGFSGRWSTKGKFILILVMFFGRLKKFNMHGGKSWLLS